MKNFQHYIALFVLILCFACEKEIDLDIPTAEPKVVVEGYISNDAPGYVILTKTTPFFDPTTIEDIENSFIHGALVTVSDGDTTVVYNEYASDTLPEPLVKILRDSLGLNLPTGGQSEITFYFYTNFAFFGKVGRGYDLEIDTGEETLSAFTTIPQPNPIDSLWATDHPGGNDTLAILNGRFTDPAGERNYIRYFTKVNDAPFFTPYFGSVLDDNSFFDLDGQTFNFALEKGHSRFEDIDFDTYTYFTKGDTVTVRWSAIDEAHHRFWSTLEFDRNGTGNPFSRTTVIQSNVTGGIGIWGGYGTTFHEIIIPKD